MIITSESKIKIEKYLDRCLTLKGYTVSFYVADSESSELLLQTIFHYYKSMAYEDEIETISRDLFIQIVFKNRSIIRIFDAQQKMVSDICSNLVYVDSRICEKYTSKSPKYVIQEYDLGNGNFILNPDPIRIDYIYWGLLK